MNVYSYICILNKNAMARKIDDDKIARIKAATMKTIVDYGIEATTIAMIAKNANVSGGYLYRIYSGKQELINELFYEKISSLFQELEFLIALNNSSIAPIISAFVQNRIVYALNEPVASNFFYQLLHNDNFSFTDELKDKSLLLMQNIKEIGINAGEISSNKNLFQLYYHFFVYVVDYIHFKRNNIFGNQDLTNDDVEYLTNNILNFLKRID
ncbi:MAG TPA: TetR/AcrR family transcriptional regulator [Lutibacter sp.]|nr:TetR/AcrR family transcriptional regulator [Lutibacter sp.]